MKKLLTIVCASALLFTAGCFDYEETLVFNEDGSGTVAMKIGMNKVYLVQLQMIQAQVAAAMPEAGIEVDPTASMFNKQEIENTLAAQEAGVQLLYHKLSETEENQVWDIKFSFNNIQNLALVYEVMSPDEINQEDDAKSQETEIAPLTQQEDGSWLFYRPIENGSGEEEYADEMGEYSDEYSDEQYYDQEQSETGEEDIEQLGAEMEAGLEEYAGNLEQKFEGLGDHKIRFSVTFPGDIIESNATKVEGRTAIWEYTLEQMSAANLEQRAVYK